MATTAVAREIRPMHRPSQTERLWLRLFLTRGVGWAAVGRLHAAFGSMECLFDADLTSWPKLRGRERIWTALHDDTLEARADDLEADLSRISGARVLTPDSPDYPEKLLQLPAYPAALFVRGTLQNELPAVAVVGSRRATRDQKDLTREWCSELARSGVSVVSGLAEGIDGAAHEGALSGSGHTLAVLGTGLDKTYPWSHAHLVEQILEGGGAVLSQFAPGAESNRGCFAARNATMAALSDLVTVMLAGRESGALITARHARELSKPVFAVPSHPRERSNLGCLELLKTRRAQLATSPADLTSHLGLSHVSLAASIQKGSTDEERVLCQLSLEGIDLNELTRRLDWPASTVLEFLLRLELAGMVVRQPGPRYARTR